MKKYLRMDEKELLDDAYSIYAERVQKIPYPTLKGIKFILDEMAEKHPQARRAAPENFRRSFTASRNRTEWVFQAAVEKLAQVI